MSDSPIPRRFADYLAAWRNAIDYPLRQAVRLRRPGLRFHNEPKQDLFAHLPAAIRSQAVYEAGRLVQAYHLQAFYNDSLADNFCENLYYLELLKQALEEAQADLPASLLAVDVGPSHWFYVQALVALLRWWRCPAGRAVCLDGYEADPYRVYTDLRSRYDHAQAHLRGLAEAHYIPRPFTPLPATFDLATMFFPFVFIHDHLEWGLPRPLFAPHRLLGEVCASLKPGGWLVIVNQGEAEHQVQRALLTEEKMTIKAAFCFESWFYQYDLPRYVLVTQK